MRRPQIVGFESQIEARSASVRAEGRSPARRLGARLRRTLAAALRAGIATIAAATPLGAQGDGYTLSFSEEIGLAGGEVEVAVLLDFPNAPESVSGWSFGVCHDDLVDVIDVAQGSTTASLDPVFYADNVFPGSGWTVAVVIDFFSEVLLEPGSGYELMVADYALLEIGTATLDYCSTLGVPPVAIQIADESGAASNVVLEEGTIEVGEVPPFLFRAGSATAAPGAEAVIAIEMDNLQAVDGFSFGLGHDAAVASLEAIDPGPAVAALNGGMGASFFHADLAPAAGSGGTVICLASTAPPFDTFAAGSAHAIAEFRYSIDAQAADGTTAALEFLDGLGTLPVAVAVAVQGTSASAATEPGALQVSGTPVSGDPEFVRGDATADGEIALLDAVKILNWLFGEEEIACVDAADANDNGSAALDDALFVLSFLFLDGAAIPPPAGACGLDATPDALECESFAGC